ncbi:Rid family hydrolase [Herbaspirillum sp. LeCh32-8]|uniref:RidA family protein n=1 Tax=Herbaspirillum sp. LeCh32-8 TaxID=2821356 RepID=UPI001FD7AF33|nr:Rid family hydrolase [Herbaspirillum sp. LeCh32-8]
MRNIVLGICAGMLPFSIACAEEVHLAKPAAPSERIEFFNPAGAAPYPFSKAVRVGGTLYLSGELGTVGSTGKLAPGGMQAEARQTLSNIQGTLAANGYRMSDVVKCTALLADMSEWPMFNEIYKTFFSKPYPARSALGANGLALGARVEMECIAAK